MWWILINWQAGAWGYEQPILGGIELLGMALFTYWYGLIFIT